MLEKCFRPFQNQCFLNVGSLINYLKNLWNETFVLKMALTGVKENCKPRGTNYCKGTNSNLCLKC